MVDEQLRARGVRDPRVLAVMGEVPRHRFVSAELRERAYGDWALPSLAGQTISQPYMVARMLELLEVAATHRVLEVGTGTGYQTLLLSRLAFEVFSVERLESLLEAARARLAVLGATNVRLLAGDGSLGWSEFAPYDRVLVAAAAPRVPRALRGQLGERGLLVIPVGGPQFQHLEAWRRLPGGRWERRRHGECRFVPLVGRDAWRDEHQPPEVKES
jgi:protein-L-isoaspartate(D-aspartate) O-methyltransferase